MRAAAIALTFVSLTMAHVAVNNLHLIRLPEVERPRVDGYGFCIDPGSDEEVERCGGGLSWAHELIAKRIFMGEQ